MSPRSYRPFIVVTILTTSAIALASGCAETSIDVGVRPVVDASVPPSFTPPDAGGDADAWAPAVLQLCIATTCPAPYATCGEGYRCATNLSNDANNCGTCGNTCPQNFGYLNMVSTCVNGACEPQCAQVPMAGGSLDTFADCNKVLEDGCEVSLSTDPKNCGACGTACAPGVRCIEGKCGCPGGQMDCNGACVDVQRDDGNCGACGNACTYPADAAAPPAHMEYGCIGGQCGQLRCIDFYGDTWADCDNDLKNGCETFIGIGGPDLDPNNCGKCGNKCTGDQICSDTNLDWFAECSCTKPHETRCGSLDTYDLGCYDLLNDPNNCGTCFHACPAYAEHSTAACRKGVCEIECAPGWGDCDGNPTNGCESNLKISDGHCGACGHRCDTQAGQPCVDGQCAMTECDAGTGPK